MKKIIVLAMALCALQISYGQIKFGPRVSVGSNTVKPNDLLVTNRAAVDSLKFAFNSSRPNIQVGGFLRAGLGSIYVQPEVLFTFTSVSYDENNLLSSLTNNDLKENLTYLDIPVNVGVKLGPAHVQAGPVFGILLSSNSDLQSLDGITREFKNSSVLGQVAAGLDLGRFIFDLKYEFALGSKTDSINLLGNDFDLSHRDSQIVLSVGYSL